MIYSLNDCDGSRQRPGTTVPLGTALARVCRLSAFKKVFLYYFVDHSERPPCLMTSHFRGTAVPPQYRGTTRYNGSYRQHTQYSSKVPR